MTRYLSSMLYVCFPHNLLVISLLCRFYPKFISLPSYPLLPSYWMLSSLLKLSEGVLAKLHLHNIQKDYNIKNCQLVCSFHGIISFTCPTFPLTPGPPVQWWYNPEWVGPFHMNRRSKNVPQTSLKKSGVHIFLTDIHLPR